MESGDGSGDGIWCKMAAAPNQHLFDGLLYTDTLECSDFEFFEKMENNNSDMVVTCKCNTYLEKALSVFWAILCGFSFKVCKKWLKVLIRPPQKKFFDKKSNKISKKLNFMLISERMKSCKKCTHKKLSGNQFDEHESN